MSEQQQASQPAEVTDVFNGHTPSLHEFNQYRETGEVPERFKTSDKAAAESAQDLSEGAEPGSDPDSEAGQQQEKQDKPKNQTASERVAKLSERIEREWQEEEPDTVKIAQMTATIEKIERSAGLKRKAEVVPATEAPKQQQAQEQEYRAKPKAEDTDKDGKPKYATYEDFVEDLADWKAEQRVSAMQRDQVQREQLQHLQKQVEEGKSVYGDDFGEIADSVAGAILSDKDIPGQIRQRLAKSKVLPHLVYTLGGDHKALDQFIATAKSDPDAARDYIAVIERDIIEELGKSTNGDDKGRDESGKFVSKESPAKPKTSAPKPPTPVSGASSSAFDVSDESLTADEWMRKRNTDIAKRKA